jgi:uncharacterized protein YndB with AHSA1/START domain
MTFEPTPAVPVERERTGDAWTLVFVRDLRHPREKVWAALTDPDHLDKWSPFRPDRDLGTTGPATLTMVDGDGSVDSPGNITRAEPPALLEYQWDDDFLRWELAEIAGGTRLTLRHTMNDESYLPRVATGWHICLDVADLLLSGNPVPVVRGEDAKKYGFDTLSDEYAAMLGIEPKETD